MNASSAKRHRKKQLGRAILQEWQLYAILFLPLVWLIVFSYVPMYGVLIAFTKYNIANGLTASRWIGLDNFYRFFSTPSAVSTMRSASSRTISSTRAGMSVKW